MTSRVWNRDQPRRSSRAGIEASDLHPPALTHAPLSPRLFPLVSWTLRSLVTPSTERSCFHPRNSSGPEAGRWAPGRPRPARDANLYVNVKIGRCRDRLDETDSTREPVGAAGAPAVRTTDETGGASPPGEVDPGRYKWIVLSNTTLGMLMATIDLSIMLIALPDIFRGIHINPLTPGNSFYLLWMILSFMIVTSVLVVSLGRLGDMYGRVRTYNLGFAVYTFFSLLLTVTWMSGTAGALWLVIMRVFQGVGRPC